MFIQRLKNIYHFFRSIAAAVWFGFPANKLVVIGVTGTNGKTTTVQMIVKVLEAAGYKVAMSSTINFKIAGKEWVNRTKYTTRSGWQVQKFIRQAVDAGCQYLVLETSSHSLDQNRVWGIAYDVAVITNVTREHLDYHRTMVNYHRAKERLFTLVSERKQKMVEGKLIERVLVVNAEMDKADLYLKPAAEKKYIYQVADTGGLAAMTALNDVTAVVASEVVYDLQGVSFQVGKQAYALNLVGRVNVENALAAIATGISQGCAAEKMSEALAMIEKIPGRMDKVANNRGVHIIIDYALTPDSMEKLGSLILGMKKAGAKLIWVFGSCGERDRGKRPIMGAIVANYADLVLVTNEDPYHEDPKQIIDEVFKGVVENDKGSNVKIEGVNAWRIMDRKKAIEKALKLAVKDDIVLITGKGAEETMAIGDERIEWNDRQVVMDILAK
jgi:UDP-N-acetylmuramoyl-L-alanyl-D-glutamate--2,6-diaminopimelate ligase